MLNRMPLEYPLGLSLPENTTDSHIIYSIASHKNCKNSQDIFATEHINFYKIGQYCNNLLLSVLERYGNEKILQNDN